MIISSHNAELHIRATAAGVRCRAVMLLCAMLIATVAVSCSDSEPTPVPVEPVAKTTVIYMPWTASESSTSGSLYDSFLKNISDIESAIAEEGGLHGTRLMVAIAQSYSRLELIEISYDGTRCVRDTLQRYANPKYATEAWLTELLDDVARTSPARRYTLLVGSHGTGWLPAGSKPERLTAFGGRTPSTQATVECLAAAIAASAMKHVECIGFDDCYMCNVETAYALRQVTDFLIASTSEVMSTGFPYAQVWKYLYGEPDYDKVCTEFLRFYQSFWLPYGTLSVIDCAKTEKLAALMRQLNVGTVITEERIADVQKLDGFELTVFYDFADYVAHATDDEALKSAINAALNEAVVATCCTPKLYSTYLSSYDHTFDVTASCGISISDISTNKSAIYAKLETEWWQATH